MPRRLLEQFDDVLQIALEVSMPSLKEEAKEPIERHRLLSPTAECRIRSKARTEDLALSRLISDAEIFKPMRAKVVTRMQNTITYSEEVRQEWQEKMEEHASFGRG